MGKKVLNLFAAFDLTQVEPQKVFNMISVIFLKVWIAASEGSLKQILMDKRFEFHSHLATVMAGTTEVNTALENERPWLHQIWSHFLINIEMPL